MEEGESIKDLLKKLVEQNERLVSEKQTKQFKLPWSGRIGKLKAKKNYATIVFINENREVRFLKSQIDEGTIMIDGVPRMATTDHILTHKGKPMLIVTEWSTKPFSPEQNYTETQKESLNSAGAKLLLNKMEKEVITKKKMSGGIIGWIILGIAVVGVAYYFLNGGKII